jgi:hypothetical protein
MWIRLTWVTLTLAALTACETASAPDLPVTTPSFGQILLNETFPVAGTLPNPCPPAEEVAFEGKLHVLVKGTPGDFTVHTNAASIHGVGLTSGDRYVLKENEKSHTVANLDGNATQDFNFRFHMVREGSADNFWYRTLIRFTLSPDGEILGAEVLNEEVQCRG